MKTSIPLRPRTLVLVTLCAVLAAANLALAADDGPAVANWKLKCADGSRVEFHEALAKGPVLVSFWALWCKPCLKELPHLNKLAKELGDKLTVFAVNIDSPKSVAKVRPYLKSKKYDLMVPLDTAGDLTRLMQVGGMVPYLVLYDGDGNIVYKHTGYKEGDEKELRDKVLELVASDAEPAAATAGSEG